MMYVLVVLFFHGGFAIDGFPNIEACQAVADRLNKRGEAMIAYQEAFCFNKGTGK